MSLSLLCNSLLPFQNWIVMRPDEKLRLNSESLQKGNENQTGRLQGWLVILLIIVIIVVIALCSIIEAKNLPDENVAIAITAEGNDEAIGMPGVE